jgi:hypothetical protein
MPNVFSSAPTMIASNPNCMKGETVVTQPTDGTTTLLFLGFEHLIAYAIKRFADDPELQKTEYLVPM